MALATFLEAINGSMGVLKGVLFGAILLLEEYILLNAWYEDDGYTDKSTSFVEVSLSRRRQKPAKRNGESCV